MFLIKNAAHKKCLQTLNKINGFPLELQKLLHRRIEESWSEMFSLELWILYGIEYLKRSAVWIVIQIIIYFDEVHLQRCYGLSQIYMFSRIARKIALRFQLGERIGKCS